MTFVQRDKNGGITGVYAVAQREVDGSPIAIEELPEDHPDVVAFRDRIRFSPPVLTDEQKLERLFASVGLSMEKGRELLTRTAAPEVKK